MLMRCSLQQVGFLFAPIVCIWLLCISAIGLYNFIHWHHHVYRALSPYYMYQFLKKTQTGGWPLDVNGWNLSTCNMYRYAMLLLPAIWLWPYLNWNVIRLTPFSIIVETFVLWSYVCRSWILLTIINSGMRWVCYNLQEHNACFVRNGKVALCCTISTYHEHCPSDRQCNCCVSLMPIWTFKFTFDNAVAYTAAQ
jgi:hypothetical protein